MGDGSLTQDEIDLLLQGADKFGSVGQGGGPGSAAAGVQDMSPLERDAIAEALNQAFQTGAQSLSRAVGKTVKVGAAYAEIRAQKDIDREFASDYVLIRHTLSGPVSGMLALVMPAAMAGRLAGIVMGLDAAPSQTMDSAQLATYREALTTLMNAASGHLSSRVGGALTALASDAEITRTGRTFPFKIAPAYVRVQLPFSVEGILDSRLHALLPISLAHDIVQHMRSPGQSRTDAAGFAQESALGHAAHMAAQLGIKEVQFPQISTINQPGIQPDLELLLDVQMTLTVELGRTKMVIKEILALGEGSIIELDKLAGEPVDLLVNSKLIAKGEVVVIDENFGVRVTDIVSSADRLKAMKNAKGT